MSVFGRISFFHVFLSEILIQLVGKSALNTTYSRRQWKGLTAGRRSCRVLYRNLLFPGSTPYYHITAIYVW